MSINSKTTYQDTSDYIVHTGTNVIPTVLNFRQQNVSETWPLEGPYSNDQRCLRQMLKITYTDGRRSHTSREYAAPSICAASIAHVA